MLSFVISGVVMLETVVVSSVSVVVGSVELRVVELRFVEVSIVLGVSRIFRLKNCKNSRLY